jgi:hypothetical protein
LGVLNVEGVNHKPFFTLELPWRDNIENVSCIPEGNYQCAPFNGAKYKDVYEIKGVEGRKDILFHVGNYVNNTKGCVLIGSGISFHGDTYMVTSSKISFERFRGIMGDDEFKLSICGI